MAGTSLVPALPLFQEQVDKALRIFKRLRIPDIAGTPTMAQACGQWLFPLVAAMFGSLDPVTQTRMIQEFFLLVPKGNAKTSYGGAILVVALIMNERPEAEFHLIAPTMKIAEYAYKQAKGTIALDPALLKIFHPQNHLRMITHRTTGATLQIKAADTDVITGGKQVGTMIDETHVFAEKKNAEEIFVEIRGALGKRPDGFLLQTTTQSKKPPSGVWKAELHRARMVRDGQLRLPLLPILYELPRRLIVDNGWKDRKTWHLVNPNYGLSVRENFLADQLLSAEQKGIGAVTLLASQHFNVEIGIGLRTDRWPGAEFWLGREDALMMKLKGRDALNSMLERCEVVVVGIDGGGLDDLFGLTVLGRVRGSRRNWLQWSHGWCHRGVLERRQSIAQDLEGFEAAGELTIVDDELNDISEIVDIIVDIDEQGLLHAVAVDPAGLGELVDELAEHDITQDNGKLIGVAQGYSLMNAIKTAERKLARKTLLHSGNGLMTWCVANLKIEPTATAIRATKQNAGDAKIDLAMSMFDAVSVMSTNPEAQGPSVYEDRGLLEVELEEI
ncbi:terminase TerL endonuclease subunit [Devosia sp. 1635]|uniref:terminase large subunit n=1 Tax=Devosia sp. 1635 TaxID=2726066 RepID=UPI0015679E93|nr:terminase TerL endonuclease subunit [Devosia sp. 1635]